ncbi:MAG: YugN family protein [Firmicutes bacterium]|uniref:YugN-like family protein n=1 Tax=Melghirimyces thermohalophilus TaxID=1236220 RepID=A0A1G6RQ97_9BACL|nr:YugN family protein [Melghirimyces thermohalophilus]MDA8353285.1 YugN family protein [Bacillota bacterium]SDD06116.1 YugN-like family protein [Melghirimyces thermohalophilus]
MVLEDAGLKGMEKTLGAVEPVMNAAGFFRGGAWDYTKVNFDKKLLDGETEYYLRIRAYAKKGRPEKAQAVIQLENPVLLRHYFPHGLEETDEIPESLQEEVQSSIQQVKENLSD